MHKKCRMQKVLIDLQHLKQMGGELEKMQEIERILLSILIT